MAEAPTGTVLYRDASIDIGGEQYENAITRARLVPETPVVSMQTLDPEAEIVHTDTATWTFELTGVQVWAAAGIAKVLHDLAGTDTEVILAPQKGTGKPEATFTIVPVALPFGGERGQILTFEQSYKVKGQPVFGVVSA